jgi:aa3 type cytochrome c oxidase subunit IV
MAEHKHGSMDTSVQEQSFSNFIRYSSYVGVFSIGVLIFLAIFNS